MTTATPPPSAPDALQAAFLELMPGVQKHAEITFRHLRCEQTRDDRVAEAVAVAWRWYVRAWQKGKDLGDFPAALASLAARHVRSGRRLCGQERSRDVLSPLAQARHGFATQPLSERARASDLVRDALIDNTVTPPPDAAAFRLDFPVWLSLL